MKHFTLSVFAAACSMAAFAQSPYAPISGEGDSYLQGRAALKQQRVEATVAADVQASTLRRAKAEDGLTAMFDQPEGELSLMRRSGKDWLPMWGMYTSADYTEKGTWVVKGTDGNYYFKNFVTNMCNGGAWVKGTVEGDIVKVATGQICTQLWWFNGTEDELFTYYLYGVVEFEHTGFDEMYGTEYTYYTYDVDPSVESIDFKIEADGSLTCVDPDIVYGGFEILNDAWNWPGYGDQGCSFYAFDEVAQEAPADVEFSDYAISHSVYGAIYYNIIQGAQTADNLYLSSLVDILPEGVVIADIDGDKAVVASDQFLGVDHKYSTLVYARACSYREELDEWGWAQIYTEPIDQLVLAYDAATKHFSSNDQGFVLNAGKSSMQTHENYLTPTIYQFVEAPAVPATPEWSQFMPYTEFDWGAWGYAGFSIFTKDVDGNYILPEKIYFTCYLDDTPLVVTDNNGQEITDIPYSLVTNDIIGGSDLHYVYFYQNDFERFGVQSVYCGGGEEMRSPIVYYGEEPGDPVGLDATASPVASTCITDAAGRIRTSIGQGLNIITVTYADGTRKVAKLMVK